MVHQAKAIFLDGVNPHARAGRLVYDAVHHELHFYERPTDETQSEFFAFSVDKNHVFEIRRRGHEHVIEWRSGAGNYTSAMFVVSDLAFIRLVRDKFLSHKNLFWRYATLVWSESLSRVILALMIGTCITGFGAYTFMQNSYHIVPQAWDQRVGDQAEAGLKEFGVVCSSPQVVADLKKLIPYFREHGTPYKYEIQVVKSPVENAFALPGGKITVFSETIRKAANYEELAGILAHEIGHVERRHGMQQLSQYMTIRVILALAFGMTDDGTTMALAADAGALLLLLKNSRDHERDADAYAARKLAEAGISSLAIRKFFQRLNEEHKEAIDKVPDFVLTHPSDADRIQFFERYENKHKGRMLSAAARLDEDIRLMLPRKPVVSAECIAPQDDEAEEED